LFVPNSVPKRLFSRDFKSLFLSLITHFRLIICLAWSLLYTFP
jgi:hypothetical protein